MLITLRSKPAGYFKITAVATNNPHTGALNREKVDDLWRLALLSEIAFHQNTSQVLGGDAHGTWLIIRCGSSERVAENVLEQAEAAGFEVERVVEATC